MTKEELLEKLDEISQKLQAASVELDSLRESILALAEPCDNSGKSVSLPLPDAPNYAKGYTLDDLYKAFGPKKQTYANRLKSALRKRQITSLQDFLLLTPSELLELDNVGYGTLQKTQAALKRLGIDW